MTELRALITCVEYHDLLEITLPHNKHHFSEIIVVTHKADEPTHQVAAQLEIDTFNTNAFYNNGALFNKWAAIEHALDHFGRHGWLCLLDADTLWPSNINWPELTPNNLYGPPRRILDPVTLPIPHESLWNSLPIEQNSLREFPGYSQIFHALDIHLPTPPWHNTNWKHAGREDSFFQKRWPANHKIRLPFHALHLGPTGQNWAGRTQPFLNGSTPTLATERANALHQFRSQTSPNPHDRYQHERLQ